MQSDSPEEPNPGLERPRHQLRASGVKDEAAKPLRSGIHTRGYLPHVKRGGASYFVTFRLADSLSKEVLLKFESEKAGRLRRLEEFSKGGETGNDSLRPLDPERRGEGADCAIHQEQPCDCWSLRLSGRTALEQCLACSHVAQTSKSAVSRVSKPASASQWHALPIGNRRYSRFGNLRYGLADFVHGLGARRAARKEA
jgi:hypothetical protein